LKAKCFVRLSAYFTRNTATMLIVASSVWLTHANSDSHTVSYVQGLLFYYFHTLISHGTQYVSTGKSWSKISEEGKCVSRLRHRLSVQNFSGSHSTLPWRDSKYGLDNHAFSTSSWPCRWPETRSKYVGENWICWYEQINENSWRLRHSSGATWFIFWMKLCERFNLPINETCFGLTIERNLSLADHVRLYLIGIA
jgi:hypothetical protein